MKATYVLATILFALLAQYAQAQDYSFTHDNSQYNELVNPTIISKELDPALSYGAALEEKFSDIWDFDFFGEAMKMDSIFVGTSGFVLMQSSNDLYIVAIDPFVYTVSKHDTSSSISCGIDIVNGIKYFVVQWKNVESTDFPGKIMSIQVRIKEGSNDVTFHYGNSDIPNGSATSEGVQVGMFLLNADFQLVKLITISGQPDNPTGNSGSFAYLQGYPANGKRYILENNNNSAVEEIQTKQALVYPNPTQGEYSLVLDKVYSEVTLTVRSTIGEVISTEVYNNVAQISSEFDGASGLYFLELLSEYATWRVVKLWKE